MSNWATHAIEKLRRGESTQMRPRGQSMKGKINDGQLVTLRPYNNQIEEALTVGEVVLVKVRGRVYLHTIKATMGHRYLIGNERGGINGWVSGNAIYGVVTEVT